VKSLARRDFPLHYFGAHRPVFRATLPSRRNPIWTNGSGRAVETKFLNNENRRLIRKYQAKGARAFATLNHYALKSLDSYLVKNDRGCQPRASRV